MDAWKKYHKTACTSLPENEHLDVQNMSSTCFEHPSVYHREDLYIQLYPTIVQAAYMSA
jgi:hypothetical protein